MKAFHAAVSRIANRIRQAIKHRLAFGLVCLFAATWRFSLVGAKPETPCILVFWHDEMLPVWRYFRAQSADKKQRVGATALVSASRDGSVLAFILKKWGYDLVRGSSSKKGNEALEEIIRRAPTSVCMITPDGPRGPRHTMKRGALLAAARAGVPILWCRARAKGWRFRKTWDMFLLPYPFARVRLYFSESVSVTRLEVGAILDDELRRVERLSEMG
jgi:lysophospholipid acyltransferase (LPLAT)-like uncharacterized protein